MQNANIKNQNEKLKCKKNYFFPLRVNTLAPITFDISSASFKSCFVSALNSGIPSLIRINQYFVHWLILRQSQRNEGNPFLNWMTYPQLHWLQLM